MGIKEKQELSIKEIENALDSRQLKDLLNYVDFRKEMVNKFNGFPLDMNKIYGMEDFVLNSICKGDPQYSNFTKNYDLNTLIVRDDKINPNTYRADYICDGSLSYMALDDLLKRSIPLVLSFVLKKLKEEYPEVVAIKMNNAFDYSNKCDLERKLIDRSLEIVFPYKYILPRDLEESRWKIYEAKNYGSEDVKLLRNYFIDWYSNKYNISPSIISDLFVRVLNEDFISRFIGNYPGVAELLTGSYNHKDNRIMETYNRYKNDERKYNDFENQENEAQKISKQLVKKPNKDNKGQQ